MDICSITANCELSNMGVELGDKTKKNELLDGGGGGGRRE